MPIEVLIRKQVEKIVEEKLKRLILDMGMSKLESTTAKLER
jgi:hypothetical protein